MESWSELINQLEQYYGWGWLAEKKFDMIQTDWLLPMRLYFQSKGIKVK